MWDDWAHIFVTFGDRSFTGSDEEDNQVCDKNMQKDFGFNTKLEYGSLTGSTAHLGCSSPPWEVIFGHVEEGRY
jgi:hypothetical protein